MADLRNGLTACLLAAVVAGCASPPRAGDETYTYRGCDAGAPAEAQERSLGALVAALERRRGWVIDRVDPERAELVARGCRGDNCISVDFRVLPDGDVEAVRSPDQYLGGSWRRTLDGWIRGLERDFAAERCRPAAELIRRLAPYRR